MQNYDDESSDADRFSIEPATQEDIPQMSEIGFQGVFDMYSGRSHSLDEHKVRAYFAKPAMERRLGKSWVLIRRMPSTMCDADTASASAETGDTQIDADPSAERSQQNRRHVIGWMTVMLRMNPAILPPRSYAAVNETVPHLAALFVDREYRRQGFGSRLIQKAEQMAYAAGKDRLELDVLTGNTEAQALYERLGYEVETVWTQRGDQEASQLRSKKLDSASIAASWGA